MKQFCLLWMFAAILTAGADDGVAVHYDFNTGEGTELKAVTGGKDGRIFNFAPGHETSRSFTTGTSEKSLSMPQSGRLRASSGKFPVPASNPLRRSGRNSKTDCTGSEAVRASLPFHKAERMREYYTFI